MVTSESTTTILIWLTIAISSVLGLLFLICLAKRFSRPWTTLYQVRDRRGNIWSERRTNERGVSNANGDESSDIRGRTERRARHCQQRARVHRLRGTMRTHGHRRLSGETNTIEFVTANDEHRAETTGEQRLQAIHEPHKDHASGVKRQFSCSEAIDDREESRPRRTRVDRRRARSHQEREDHRRPSSHCKRSNHQRNGSHRTSSGHETRRVTRENNARKIDDRSTMPDKQITTKKRKKRQENESDRYDESDSLMRQNLQDSRERRRSREQVAAKSEERVQINRPGWDTVTSPSGQW